MSQGTPLETITRLARDQWKLEGQIKKKEIELKTLQEQHRLLSEHDLPTAMDEADLETFRLTNGYSISIEKDVFVGISKERQMEAFTWLRKNGHDSLIKRDIAVKFGKGEDKLAKKLISLIRKSFRNLPISDKEHVHYQTLKAFVKEQIAAGTAIPMEPFGIVPVRRAKITQAESEQS